MTTVRLKLKTGEAKTRMRKGAGRGLTLGLEHLLTEANKIVPHQEGTLQRSGSTDVDLDALEGAVSYDTPYAVRQHEDLALRHDEGRQAKFLEQTMTSESATLGRIIATAVSRELEG